MKKGDLVRMGRDTTHLSPGGPMYAEKGSLWVVKEVNQEGTSIEAALCSSLATGKLYWFAKEEIEHADQG